MRIPLWTADLDAPRAFEHLLSSAEHARANCFLEPATRRRWIAARGWLRIVLSRATGFAPERLTLRTGLLGKPALAESDIQFSLSHSGGLALLAISSQNSIGVDIEPDDPARESALLEWTAREAYLKAVGLGLAAGLATSLPDSGWTIQHFGPAPGYLGAVAVDTVGVEFDVRPLS
jgi:phosphopantetheinyl transferase